MRGRAAALGVAGLLATAPAAFAHPAGLETTTLFAAVARPPAAPPGATLLVRLTRALPTPLGPVRTHTRYGEPVYLPVVHQTGWRATVLAPTRPAERAVAVNLRRVGVTWTDARVVVDVARLRMRVWRGKRLVGDFPIGSGGVATPTPTGRFFVTDRLLFPPGSVYGRFALGLSAYQAAVPSGWLGGDQIGIHAGAPGHVSLGCIHAPAAALRLLRREVPLGAPVVVRG